jgi:hypothetical protein
VLRAGYPWRLLPDCFPPGTTVYRWFARLRDAHVFEVLNHHLVLVDRTRTGREPSPPAAVIGSQRVKTTEGWRTARLRRRQEGKGTQAPRHGGHQRAHTQHPCAPSISPGSQWRGSAPASLPPAPSVRGTRVRVTALQQPPRPASHPMAIQIVRKFAGQAGLVVHPRRWVVERTFA